MSFIDELKAEIDKKHLLKHPFYQMWEEGALPIEVMQKYAEQYYHLEKNFPRFLSKMHADCEEFEVRQKITENLFDEEHGEENHRELWLRFGEAIEAGRKAIEEAEAISETQEAVDAFMEMSESSYLEGVAALAAYESQIPEIAAKKIEGLKMHYGIEDGPGTQFFQVHGVMDVKHADAWWDIIENYCDTPEKQEEVRQAVVKGADALWNFLSGICREYMPEVSLA